MDNQPQAPETPPTPTAPMNGQPPPTEGLSGHESAQSERPVHGEEGTVSTLVATVDQHSAEIDTLTVVQYVQMFALGALAGILYLLSRHIKELQHALAG